MQCNKGLFIWARLTGLTRLPGRILSSVHMRNFRPVKDLFKWARFTGLTRLPGRTLASVHLRNFSPVDWDKIRETKTNWRKNVVSFATVVALLTPVTLVAKLIRILPNKKSIQGKNMSFWPLYCESEAILSKKSRPGCRDGCLCVDIFSPVAEISVGKTEISATETAHPFIRTLQSFSKDLAVCRDLKKTGPAWSTGIIWRGPKWDKTR